MPWTTPETFTAGQTLTAASMNAITENTRVLNGGRTASAVAPTVKATRITSNQTVTVSASDPFQWNGESWDTDTMHDNTTNNSRITFTTAGLYLVSVGLQLSWTTNATSGQITFNRYNSAGVSQETNDPFFDRVLVGTTGFIGMASWFWSVSAGDYFTGYITSLNNATSISLVAGAGRSFASATWLGVNP